MDLTTFKLPETRGKNQNFLHPPASTSPGGPGLKRRCQGWGGGGAEWRVQGTKGFRRRTEEESWQNNPPKGKTQTLMWKCHTQQELEGSEHQLQEKAFQVCRAISHPSGWHKWKGMTDNTFCWQGRGERGALMDCWWERKTEGKLSQNYTGDSLQPNNLTSHL